MNQVIVLALSNKCLLLQQQVLTPTAADLIAKSASSLLLQTPVLLAALIALVIALVKFRRFRLVSILTILASLLMFANSVIVPLVSVWLPFLFVAQPQTLEDGTTIQPSLEILQTNLFYANLTGSAVFALALLLYVWAIFAGRGKPLVKLKQPEVNIPTISIR